MTQSPAKAAQQEREAVVKWLLKDAANWGTDGNNPVAYFALAKAANAIQSGEHRKDEA